MAILRRVALRMRVNNSKWGSVAVQQRTFLNRQVCVCCRNFNYGIKLFIMMNAIVQVTVQYIRVFSTELVL